MTKIVFVCPNQLLKEVYRKLAAAENWDVEFLPTVAAWMEFEARTDLAAKEAIDAVAVLDADLHVVFLNDTYNEVEQQALARFDGVKAYDRAPLLCQQVREFFKDSRKAQPLIVLETPKVAEETRFKAYENVAVTSGAIIIESSNSVEEFVELVNEAALNRKHGVATRAEINGRVI